MSEKETRANQRHSDYYMDLLMDQEKKPEELYIELGQIQVAFQRIKDEEVGSRFHPGALEIRLREISGRHANIFLKKLLDGSATKEEIRDVEVALESLASKFVDYPVSLGVLNSKFKEIYGRDPESLVKDKQTKGK